MIMVAMLMVALIRCELDDNCNYCIHAVHWHGLHALIACVPCPLAWLSHADHMCSMSMDGVDATVAIFINNMAGQISYFSSNASYEF